MNRRLNITSIGVGLIGVLCAATVGAVAAMAGEPAMVYAYPTVVPILAFAALSVLVVATVIQFRHPAIVAFQFALGIILNARRVAYESRRIQHDVQSRQARMRAAMGN